MLEAPQRFRPKRRWGQNFLVDPVALDAIARAFSPRPEDRVLEIGAGSGALTREIAGRVGRLLAVEVDPELAAALRHALAEAAPGGGATVVEGDILALDLEALLDDLGAGPATPARVIGNLPYNIATAVIALFLPRADRVRDLMVMVQREVAERIASPTRRKSYGGLSVLCQTYARVESIRRLRPGSFRPRPKVESEVIRLTLCHPEGAAGGNVEGFTALVHACFAQRRKTLLNNLTRPGALPDPALARPLLERAGLSPGSRAEEVPPEGFQRLFGSLKDVAPDGRGSLGAPV